jgi:hypothetical protein
VGQLERPRSGAAGALGNRGGAASVSAGDEKNGEFLDRKLGKKEEEKKEYFGWGFLE